MIALVFIFIIIGYWILYRETGDKKRGHLLIVNSEGLIVFVVLNVILIDMYLIWAILFNEAMKRRFKLQLRFWRHIVKTHMNYCNIYCRPLNLDYAESQKRVWRISIFKYLYKSVIIESKCCEFFYLYGHDLRYLRFSLFNNIIWMNERIEFIYCIIIIRSYFGRCRNV